MSETITKGDLAAAISALTGETKANSENAIEAFCEVVGNEIAIGNKVVISGWLTFERGYREARQGVNPRTGESIRIEATHTAKVKAGSKLKAKAKGIRD